MRIPARLMDCLHDPRITDVCINGSLLFADRGSGMEALGAEGSLPLEELRTWILEVLSRAGKSWDARMPFVDADWDSGTTGRFRVHAVFPPVCESGILVSLRRLRVLRSIEGRGPWAEEGGTFEHLRAAVACGESILISGATGSGKTTLASELLSQVPGDQRILALEDTAELRPIHPHFVALQSRPANSDGYGEITLRMLLRQSLRMRPDRIVLGECRGAEVLDLLQLLNTGHRGSMATIHANSPRDALKRLELLALLACPEGLPITVLREWIASGLQWIAQVEKTPDGRRRISGVARICGMECGTILLKPASGLDGHSRA